MNWLNGLLTSNNRCRKRFGTIQLSNKNTEKIPLLITEKKADNNLTALLKQAKHEALAKQLKRATERKETAKEKEWDRAQHENSSL